jgi:glycosyltransferase involved in cell wall biosynthesis
MRLVVFFTRGMSLGGWQRAGILDRELALYRGLLPHLEQLAFVTYGGADELAFASDVPGIEILPNRWGLPSNLYSAVSPFLHRRVLRQATIFKTNQINGAWSGVIAKRLFGRKLVVRCGYVWSDFVARQHPHNWRHAIALRLERAAFRAADVVIVAAEADRRTIVERYGLDVRRVHVNPNYVDTSLFRPMSEVVREPGRVTFIGRFVDQKNVLALVEAVEGLPDVSLCLIGDGPLRDQLEASAGGRGINVKFFGRLPQAELPELLNRSSVFILPSHYEGNPKALLEAMACGVPVIGARVPGIQEILVHGENGYLCGTSPAEIRAALQAVLGDAVLRQRISTGAMAYARAFCPVEPAVTRELALLRSL